MKKLFMLLIGILIISGSIGYLLINNDGPTNLILKTPNDKNRYLVQKGMEVIGSYNEEESAVEIAKEKKHAIVIDQEEKKWVYSPLEPFMIFTDNTIHDFERFQSAVEYAKKNGYNKIYYMDNYNLLWEKDKTLKEKVLIDVPLILQYPELARGCEVTSLAMLLNYDNKEVNKLELAKKVKKEEAQYSQDKDGRIFYGNPYDGFVGDMYNWNNRGYGVYHGPIAELAKEYSGDKVIDLTGLEFEEILQFIERGNPVWIITNATYKPLPEESFEIWHTKTGIVKITKKLHSVVISGYDKENVYFNDPLSNTKNRKMNKEEFKKAWEQMGNQAVVIVNK